MKHYRLEAEAAVEFDIESAFGWYEAEESGLGLQFLEQLRLVYRRILENPLGYEAERAGYSTRGNATVSLRCLFIN